jgi:hypothetical protein
MTLKPVASSSSLVLPQQGETKNMLRGVMQRSKSQSHLLAEAMQAYKMKEAEYLNTIEKVTEKNKKLLTINEQWEAKYNDLLLLHQREKEGQRSRIKKLSAQGIQDLEKIHQNFEKIVYLQDQKRICRKTHQLAAIIFAQGYGMQEQFNFPEDPKEGFPGGGVAAYLAFLKTKLDPSYHDRILTPKTVCGLIPAGMHDSDTPFEKETDLKIKNIEERLANLLKQIQQAEAALAAEEPKPNQNP